MKKNKNKLTPAQRREYVINGRAVGLSFEEISQHACQEFGSENLPKGYCKRLVHQDYQRAQSNRSPDSLHALERQAFIWELRISGLPYSEILTRLIEKMGPDRLPAKYDVPQISRDFNRELRRQQQERQQQLEAMQTLNQCRLETLFQTIWSRAVEGDLKAAEIAFKLINKLQENPDVFKSKKFEAPELTFEAMTKNNNMKGNLA